MMQGTGEANMSTVPVYSLTGKPAGELTLAEEIFGVTPNRALIHQSVVATLASRRQGSADTKTRAEVHHTTKKLFKQKGTGRARQGMRSAPHWKGGGVVFGPHPRDFRQSLPKKMRRNALLSALTLKAGANKLCVVEHFNFDQAKTREAAALLKALDLHEKKVLLVLDAMHELTVRAFRNLPNVLIVTAAMLGTVDVLGADCLLFSRDSLQCLTALKQEPLGAARWLAKQTQGGAA